MCENRELTRESKLGWAEILNLRSQLVVVTLENVAEQNDHTCWKDISYISHWPSVMVLTLLTPLPCVSTPSPIHTRTPTGFLVFLAMAVYTGVTLNYHGKRYGNWRFSWSYIIGWVSVVLTFFSGKYANCITILHINNKKMGGVAEAKKVLTTSVRIAGLLCFSEDICPLG